MPAVVYEARSTTELIALRAQQQPDDPAIYTGIPEDDGAIRLRNLSYSQFQRAVDRLAWYYSSLGLGVQQPDNSSELPPQETIAVLVVSGIDETLLELALCKLGLTPLLLSVNNSVPAIAHLSKLTKSTHLIYSPKFAVESKQARDQLKKEGYELGIIEDKRFPLWDATATAYDKSFTSPLTPDQEKDRVAIILHSSGSTGFPKPCYITHYGLIANVAINQNRTGFSTLPVYHGYGHFALFRCIYPGKPFTLFPPHLPLTSANIVAVHKASPDTRQCFAVPYVIKLLGETEDGIKLLATFDVVSFAGAPLPEDLGDRLTAAGVNLLSIYGTTETGGLMNSERNFDHDKDWNWVHPTALSKHYITFEPQGNDTYEVVVQDGYPPKIQSNRPDNSFATKDLFQRHPERKDRYKYMGRLDDTLVHILGEKTNPVPIELCIRGNSPYVAEAIVFGAAKPNAGVLILPSDLGKDLSPSELLEKVWPVIEEANSEAPSHSRILREMVSVLPYGTHIPVATKMSILRPACYKLFAPIIEEIYIKFEGRSDGVDTKKLEIVSQEALEEYLLETIKKTAGGMIKNRTDTLTKDTDLFAFGVDSLQAATVRSTLQRELEGDLRLGQSVVYEYPTVERLAAHILALKAGSVQQETIGDKMIAMVNKYSSKVQIRKEYPVPRNDDARVVVLTGASGALGAHLLHQLLLSSSVRKVICLSRANSHEHSKQRVKDSLKLRKLPIPDETRWESYTADPNVEKLGLKDGEYESIRSEVTDVIHNAWPVNFVLSLASYEIHIAGATNLINLAAQAETPGRFYFSSSVSAVVATQADKCDETFSSDPSTTQGTGYGRSKWVVEKICENVADKGLTVGVLRIGQMVGDSVHGVWNETEAWPLMFKAADTVGALPILDEQPQWLPINYAGQAIAQVVLLRDPSRARVYHIINPQRSVPWNEILEALEASGLKFDRVDKDTWVDLLTKEEDLEKNPTGKLVEYFRGRFAAPVSGKRGRLIFETKETEGVSSVIKDAPPLSGDLIGKWVASWRESGFLRGRA